MAYIKIDPVFQEDQEDLLMSYLNSDYMAPSTALHSPTTPKLSSIQELNYSTTMATSGFDDSKNNWHSTPSTPNDDLFRQQQAIASCLHPDVLNGNLQFIIPSHDQMQQQSIVAYIENTTSNMMYAPQYFPSQQQQQQQQYQYQQHQLLQQRPASPRSLSSYSSSSDSEQPKKKRGRKKRDSCHSVASSNSCGSLTPPPTFASNMPIVIAPAPIKHLPTILPAASNNNQIQDSVVSRNHDNQESSISTEESVADTQSSHILNQTYTGSSATALGSAVNPNTGLQKAATLAKRQERLIKNRAAALLSRKRKREHLSALEEQCTDLTSVNQSLLDKVSQLEKENLELKKKLDGKQQYVTTEKFSGDIISMMILCYVVFIMSFSSYTEGLGGLFTNTKLAYDLIESSSTSIATAASTSFQLKSYHEECTEDKQQRKQTFVLTSSNSTLPSTRTMNRVKRGQFQRVPL